MLNLIRQSVASVSGRETVAAAPAALPAEKDAPGPRTTGLLHTCTPDTPVAAPTAKKVTSDEVYTPGISSASEPLAAGMSTPRPNRLEKKMGK